MKHDPTTYQHLADAFLHDIATRYAFPELLNRAMDLPLPGSRAERIHGTEWGVLHAECKVQPTGQIAAIVRSMTVEVSFRPSDAKNVFYGDVKLSYDHVQGGSNGKDTGFMIAVESRFGGGSSTYLGCVDRGIFDTLTSNIE